MDNKEILKMFKAQQEQINDLTRRLDNYLNGRIDDTNDVVDLSLGVTEHNAEDRKYIAEQTARLNQITLGSIELTEEQMLEVADLYPLWKEKRVYKMGQVLKWGWNEDHESQLWEVLQDHTSQADWTPDKAVSLFKKIGFSPEGYPIWTQPLGSSDAYQKDDIVKHNGKNWISTVDNNVWSPEVYGWREYEG